MADRPRGIRPSLRLLGHYIRFNLSAAMEYRASFVTQVLGMILNDGAFALFWLILYDRIGPSIQGYGFRDVMFLWALSATGFGVAGALLGNAGQLSRLIYTGALDVYLLQPKPLLPNILGSRMVVSCWGDIVYGILLFVFTQPVSLVTVPLFLVLCLLTATGFTALQVIYHSLTFALGNAEEIAGSAANMTLSFALYPGSIFHGPSRWVLSSLLPAAILSWIPARLFRVFTLRDLLVVLGADTALVLVAVGVFRLGIRRYESGNSLVGTRQ